MGLNEDAVDLFEVHDAGLVADGFNKTALMFAVEKKFPEIEAVLRSHGAHEKS